MCPVSEDKMSAFDQAVRSDLSRLEAIRALRSSASIAHARASIARETRIAAGTLENIKRQRTKGVRGWIADTIRGALVRELQREIERLNHELQTLLQRGVDHREPEMAEVQSLIVRVRQSLEAMK
jgi:hypothetical protein